MARPQDDGVDRITRRLDADPGLDGGDDGRPSSRTWVPWVAGVAALAVVAVVAALVVTGRPGDDDGSAAAPSASLAATEPPSSAEPSPTGAATSDPAPEPTTAPPAGQLDEVPVYWTGARPSGVYLYREFRSVPDAGGPVVSAVRAMMTQTPLDPDLSSVWRQPSSLAVTQDGDALTVEVSADAFANPSVPAEQAAVAVQQLVWTATAAAQTPGPVTVLVDGGPYEAWGSVALGGPLARDETVRAMLWLDSPTEGAVLAAGTVEVTGQADVFEGAVSWDVVDPAGAVVAQGFAQAGFGTFTPFSFAVDLPPGTYTVAAWSEDVSDGESPEGPRMWEQTRTVDVE